ncbi:MAG TPA: Uma2 family endonuclease [Candidatus Hodarchaeales archaeon]|nr:Uma2 family endonuclease [Candidatus Hodarchaeales archaeon]
MAVLLKSHKEVVIEGDYILFKPDVTEEEFWKIADEDSNYELIDGALVIHSPASEEHEDIFRHLTAIIGFYLQETGFGRLYGSRLVMRLSPTWNPEPDIIIIKPEKYKNVSATRLEGPADMVVEILSKATKETDLTKKLPKYLQSGVTEVWIIDPFVNRLTVYTKEQVTEYDVPASTKITSTAFPSLPIKAEWILDRKKHPSNEIIKEMIKMRIGIQKS